MLRKIAAVLLIIPLILAITGAINPGPRWPGDPHSTTGEILFLVFGLPILVVNCLLWFEKNDPIA